MTLRHYTLIACSLSVLGAVANLTGLVALPWWLVLAPVVVLVVVVVVAFVAMARKPK